MVSSTRISQKDVTKAYESPDKALFRREGFDRKAIRYELSNIKNLDLTDKWIEYGDKEFLDANTFEMPIQTGQGEVGGAGMTTLRSEGKTIPTRRYSQGFVVQEEDVMSGAVDPQKQVAKVNEAYDIFFDAAFLRGMEDRQGNQIKPGVFQFLKQNVPAERTLDLSTFTSSPDYTQGRSRNILTTEAYSRIEGTAVGSDGRWGKVVGNHAALSKLNSQPRGDMEKTHYDMWNAENKTDMGLTESKLLVPDHLSLQTHPDQQNIQIDLSGEMGDNELLILPKRDDNGPLTDYWEIHEQSTATHQAVERSGLRWQHDYVSRFTYEMDPHQMYSDVPGVIHLTNIDSILGA